MRPSLRRPPCSFPALLFATTFLLGVSLRAELFVTIQSGTRVSAYQAFSGAVKNLDFVGGLANVGGLTVSGGDLYVSRGTAIDRFNVLTGATIATDLITGLNNGHHPVVSGSDLYIANYSSGTIGKYTTAGATVNAALITGLSSPHYLAVSGTDLYVSNFINGTIGRYTTAGDVVNAAFISGISDPAGIALHEGKLYIAASGTNQIRVHDAGTGALINGAFVTGLSLPFPIAIYKGRLYVGNFNGGTVGVYDATTGATIDADLVTGVSSIYGIAFRPVAAPTVKITGPKVVRVTRPAHRLKGTGTELQSVRVKVGRGGYKSAKVAGATWSLKARLDPGRYRVLVQATNSDGVTSPLAKATLIR